MAHRRNKKNKSVQTLIHDEAVRRNIPTAEFHSVIPEEDKAPIPVVYERRNRDVDPQLVWRGKDGQDVSSLVVQAPPLYIQENVHPKVLIDDLLRQTKERRDEELPATLDLFADFAGLPDGNARTEFYRHNANWSNRMILGDSLQVMASLAEREGMRGKVQCVYVDPPYGIKFNSNFQWSTTSRDVKDGKADHITREPEQVKAFRDTWRDGIHSYLTYLRDRLTVARDLLAESGSIFVQIGDENVHRVRALMDEVFGEDQFCGQIAFNKTGGFATALLSSVTDYIVWYAKSKESIKYRSTYDEKKPARDSGQYDWAEFPDGKIRKLSDGELANCDQLPDGTKILAHQGMASQGIGAEPPKNISLWNTTFICPTNSHWKTHSVGIDRLYKASRFFPLGKSFRYKRFLADFPVLNKNNIWMDVGISGFSDKKLYVVQTNAKVIERCILMTTDPGDLVLDPTCGSGTTAYVAEQWGRRWITVDTSRVALALARVRIMGARYPWYILADSPEGQQKEAEIAQRVPPNLPTGGDIRRGFVYERVPHITLKSIANNAEIDVIWEKWRETLEPLRARLNKVLKKKWEEWEIPREVDERWPCDAKFTHGAWWEARVARQRKIDASITAKADHEYLYNKPYEDKSRIRVAGPFTVESLAPHRMLAVDENDELFSIHPNKKLGYGEAPNFAELILELDLKVRGPAKCGIPSQFSTTDEEVHMSWNKAAQETYKRNGERFETDLTDGEWALIEPLLPPPSRMGRQRTTDLREVINAIQYMLGTGCQWRAIPPCFPPFTTVQNYFYAWRDDGTFETMMDVLRGHVRALAGRSADPTAAAIDSQSVKTTESGGPAGYDGGKKIKGRKRHIAVDVEGTPITIEVHTADVQDRDGAPGVIVGMLEKAPEVTKLWADGGYQGPKLLSKLEELGLGGLLEIVEKPKDIKGFTVLYRRWVVERTFGWMSRCRRLAKDFERSLASSLAWCQLAACRFMMRRVAREASH